MKAIKPEQEHHVYFAIFGFPESPQQLSLKMTCDPDDIWVEGEPFSQVMPDALRRENRWIISSGLGLEASHRDHFEKLLLKVTRLKAQIKARQDEGYRMGIGVSRYYFMDDPAFYLPEDIIRNYQSLGLTISFDQIALDASPN